MEDFQKLANAIEAAGMSRSEFARRLRFHQSQMNDWCTGDRKPYWWQMVKMAQALGVSLDDLVDDSLEAVVPIATLPEIEQHLLATIRHLGYTEALRRLVGPGSKTIGLPAALIPLEEAPTAGVSAESRRLEAQADQLPPPHQQRKKPKTG